MGNAHVTLSFVNDFRETLSLGIHGVRDPQVHWELEDQIISLEPGSVPGITMPWSKRYALSGGALTIDLTSLPRGNIAALDATGLRVYAVEIRVLPGVGKTTMVFAGGAANPIELFGDTAAQNIGVQPGGRIVHYFPEGSATVSPTVKNIDVAGAGTENFEIALAIGPVIV